MSSLVHRAPLALLAALGLAACASSTTPRPASDPSTLTRADLENRMEPIEVLLQRKVPGLIVSKNQNDDIVLQIRGSSNWDTKDTPPLFILDGLPYEPGPGGALVGINPEDIDTIKVLKGPEAVIYGIDGANGVIVITMKRGAARKR